jgi:hypothetical protein
MSERTYASASAPRPLPRPAKGKSPFRARVHTTTVGGAGDFSSSRASANKISKTDRGGHRWKMMRGWRWFRSAVVVGSEGFRMRLRTDG